MLELRLNTIMVSPFEIQATTEQFLLVVKYPFDLPVKENFPDFQQNIRFVVLIRHYIALYARWLKLSDDTDTDKDGISDSLEDYIGTDKLKKDTDEDGILAPDELRFEKETINPEDQSGISFLPCGWTCWMSNRHQSFNRSRI